MNTSSQTAEAWSNAEPTKHPRGLYLLFFSEFWERFSFYGIQATLVLYAVSHFNMTDPDAALLYGAYIALNYATPVVGGLLADKWLGHRHAIYLGGGLLIIGNLLLMISTKMFLLLGLATITLGTGFFKPNVSTLVGQLYTENDSRRDSGFTIFYMGINLGGVLGSVLYGLISTYYTWSLCFALGALGMLSGLLLFYFKQSLIRGVIKAAPVVGISKQRLVMVYAAIAFCCAVFGFLLARTEVTGLILEVVSALTFLGLIGLALFSQPLVRNRIFALLLFCFYYMVWAACFFQTGASLTLFIERNVVRDFMGKMIPTAFFFSIEGLFIVSLAPLFAKLWEVLGRHQREPSIPAKFALGILLTAVSFGILTLAANTAAINEYCSPLWIILAYFIMACGELSLSPIGLSAMTRLAPKSLVSLFVGTWFLASSLAGYAAGVIAKLASIQTVDNAVPDLRLAAQSYAHIFYSIFWVVLAVGVVAVMLIPFTKYLIRVEETSVVDTQNV